MLHEPPGTGKTLLSRAVAHREDHCFIHIKKITQTMQQLFIMAHAHAPGTAWMDEADSIILEVVVVVVKVVVLVMVKFKEQCLNY